MVIDVKDVFINNSFNFINRHQNLDHYNEVKVKYGLEVMYSFITKTIAILIMSYFIGALLDNIFVLLFYGLLRTYAHGIHAKSNSNCWISTMLTYLVSGLFCKYINIPVYILYILSILTIVIVVKYSPSDTIYRPIRRREKRIKLKIISTFLTILMSLILLFTKFNYKNSIVVSFILCIIAINPITYKLLKMPRDNYKN